MKISTTITKKFFDLKMQDLAKVGYFFEYKAIKSFWVKRLDKFCPGLSEPTEIVFLVGNVPHRFKVLGVCIVPTESVCLEYQKAIKTNCAYAIKCVPFVPQRGQA